MHHFNVVDSYYEYSKEKYFLINLNEIGVLISLKDGHIYAKHKTISPTTKTE